MRKLIMKMSVSVDGFAGGPNGEKDWVFKSSDEHSRAWLVEHTRQAGLIIMGRKSFEMMAPYWVTAHGPLAEAMNEIPKAVFTQNGFAGVSFPDKEQTPATASWAGAKVLDGDLAESIKALKAQPGKPIIAMAGAGFMRNLIATGLVDEYHLVTHPVLLGAGEPVFTGLDKPLHLKLADVKSFPGGIVVHMYQPE
ncbi:dihydrofolate reductase family protein [Deminuibacter soli]|uniref:Dihydrofolate reductase n=1 Tax=Deminuibacter soli TaxID=2291815 RepID=A0A3E1NRC3_9BACT|nr:dihydrofolate reductase family protein [Deminuibacter soli]RFM30447.1 dihydrofolate reductase [Deminuibacter soli]